MMKNKTNKMSMELIKSKFIGFVLEGEKRNDPQDSYYFSYFDNSLFKKIIASYSTLLSEKVKTNKYIVKKLTHVTL